MTATRGVSLRSCGRSRPLSTPIATLGPQPRRDGERIIEGLHRVPSRGAHKDRGQSIDRRVVPPGLTTVAVEIENASRYIGSAGAAGRAALSADGTARLLADPRRVLGLVPAGPRAVAGARPPFEANDPALRCWRARRAPTFACDKARFGWPLALSFVVRAWSGQESERPRDSLSGSFHVQELARPAGLGPDGSPLLSIPSPVPWTSRRLSPAPTTRRFRVAESR